MSRDALAHTTSQEATALLTDYGKRLRQMATKISDHKASNDVDDLLQAGWIGLLEAARNYDPSHGAGFWTYAAIRVEGAMRDEVRAARYFTRAVGAEYVLQEYNADFHDSHVGVEDYVDPFANWPTLIADLPERERQAVALHLIRGINLRLVGKAMGVTESRVAQIVARALKRLRGDFQ